MRPVQVAAVLSALLLAGCGGGSLSNTQLRSQATSVCTTANERSDRIATPRSPAQGLGFLREGVAVLRPELAHLRTLEAPNDLAQTYSVSLAVFSRELQMLEKTAQGLAVGVDPVTAMKALQARLAPLERREDGAWRTLDVPACLNR